uniref:Barrier-to-autointegration factor n=1 Tax=Monopterus albus TaxID=43700 RepID=A0A3Q3JXD9_MONAL|nr:barrier-to-autointegration factor [Monopterus albus]XP_020456185.1 barrier-to-autointegration factor [Monopterus albus]XP_020456186.1 barrier-to-autointegration factor [Monopterus albus]XP_020456187.1 barrier-to-autointegration factor [Monopterus albus]XP_020456188.1 barrier-to-autointegration factor [Monopterus albus]XP_020456189.1 barrier-to-autointegration factor [Monopterus albus]XP_020456190.1 barrier-to-autointegration factor [Monopterus albus]
MSSTSQKHRDFVAEPMGEKSVMALAGIGEVLGKRLEDKGFDKAYVVLGQFLVLKKDEELFRDWLKDTCGANSKQQGDCCGCLKEWCDAFL